jgi:hypothetical protein
MEQIVRGLSGGFMAAVTTGFLSQLRCRVTEDGDLEATNTNGWSIGWIHFPENLLRLEKIRVWQFLGIRSKVEHTNGGRAGLALIAVHEYRVPLRKMFVGKR